MIFLIFGILETIATVVMAIFAFKAPSALTIISLIVMALNCVLFFSLYFSLYCMRKDVDTNEENISILQDSLNQCRKKLGLALLEKEYEEEKEEEFVGDNKAKKNECPACFHHIEKGDKECPNCGYKLK